MALRRRMATCFADRFSPRYAGEAVHGRSGGGLWDIDAKVLIGVVQGYEVPPWGRRGIYVSHQAVLRFLRNQHEYDAHSGRIRMNPFQLSPCPI
jgi:hypothetical protein